MQLVIFAWSFVLVCISSGWAVAGSEEAAQASFPAEVQVNLCSEPQEIIQALQLKRKGVNLREAWYFDTAKLDLFMSGVLVRLRISDKKSELTLKFAHQNCPEISLEFLPADQAKCEYDLHGEKLEGAVSISRSLETQQVDDLLNGSTALVDHLSPVQVRYLREGVDVWPLPSGLKLLGPGTIDTYKNKNHPFTVEIWQLQSGLRTVEISQKSTVADARSVEVHLKEILASSQVKICEDQGSQAGRKLKEYVQGL